MDHQPTIPSPHVDTLLAHIGTMSDPATGAITTPIHLSTAFGHPGLGRSTGYDYARTANPTRDVLQRALADLECGVAGFATSSGMAAIDLALALAPHGSHVIALEDLYGGTYRYLSELDDARTYAVEFADGEEGLREALDRHPRSDGREGAQADGREGAGSAAAKAADGSAADVRGMVLVESPTNPMMVEIDLEAVARSAHERGFLVVVDNTFYTPLRQRPLTLGADVVVHSATKYLGGHNDVLAGAVVTGRADLAERLASRLNMTGATLDPFDCWLLMRGLKTLALRMERHEANARLVAAALEESPHVAYVLYPGHSGMIAFEPVEGVDLPTVLESVGIFTFAESLGGVESLVTCPAVQTHADVPPRLRASYGLTDRLLRLSVGIEHGQDLVDDILAALAAGAAARG